MKLILKLMVAKPNFISRVLAHIIKIGSSIIGIGFTECMPVIRIIRQSQCGRSETNHTVILTKIIAMMNLKSYHRFLFIMRVCAELYALHMMLFRICMLGRICVKKLQKVNCRSIVKSHFSFVNMHMQWELVQANLKDM